MAIITDEKRIDEVLSRGVHDVFTKEELKKRLMSGEQLHIKLGTDVTGSFLHLGHAVMHRKMRDLQELGHRATLIIGDFTTLVGDHSDKVDMRAETNSEEIKEREATWEGQFYKTVLKENTEIRHNSEWLSDLDFNDVRFLAKQFTVSQMLDRETFMLRYKDGKPIGLDEFLYPLMQGYDSVAIKSDVELGATDQTFNLLAGRKLMEAFKMEPQCAIAMRMLTGSDGRPMGKSLKNFIAINDEPNDMYGKVMSVVDSIIFEYFELVTRVPMEDIENMKKEVEAGENPMKYKKVLAKEIVSFYHSAQLAEQAEEHWANTFQKGEIPEEMTEVKKEDGNSLMILLVKNGIVSSNGDFRRLIEEGAITNLETDEKITDTGYIPESGTRFRVGKKRFVKIA